MSQDIRASTARNSPKTRRDSNSKIANPHSFLTFYQNNLIWVIKNSSTQVKVCILLLPIYIDTHTETLVATVGHGSSLVFLPVSRADPSGLPTAVSSRSSQLRSEAGKTSRVCLSVLDIIIFFKLAKQARITGELRTTCSNYLVGW